MMVSASQNLHKKIGGGEVKAFSGAFGGLSLFWAWSVFLRVPTKTLKRVLGVGGGKDLAYQFGAQGFFQKF